MIMKILANDLEAYMNKIILIIALLLATIFSVIAIYGFTDKIAWERFVKNPDKVNYEICSNIINQALSENNEGMAVTSIKNDFINDYRTFNSFLKLVRESNLYAIELAMQLYPLTDGGSSEDLFGQISMLVKDRPNLLLTMIDKYKVKDIHIITKMVSRFPIEEFADNLDKRINEIENRITALKGVNNNELIVLKDQCIGILFDYLRRLNKTVNKD